MDGGDRAELEAVDKPKAGKVKLLWFGDTSTNVPLLQAASSSSIEVATTSCTTMGGGDKSFCNAMIAEAARK